MGNYDDRPYEVGKGKPPRAYQFKKGVSGNPKGPRHKKKPQDASLQVLLHEAVNEPVSLFSGGRDRTFLVKQLIVNGLVSDMLSGTPAHRLKVFKALLDTGAFEPSVEDHRTTPELDEERVKEFVDGLIAEGKCNEETRHLFEEYE